MGCIRRVVTFRSSVPPGLRKFPMKPTTKQIRLHRRALLALAAALLFPALPARATSGLERVPICIGYEVDGERLDDMPMTQTALHHAKPIYEDLPGWGEDVTKCRSLEEMPDNAQRYIERVEELSGARVSVVGVGPGRDENVILHPLLDE